MVGQAMGCSNLTMKHGMIVVALLAPLLASCASRGEVRAPSQGVTAIYSPPARLEGKGKVIFLQASAPPQRVPPAPPAELTSDYMPGPWSIFFEAKSDRPDQKSRLALEQIAAMTARFPTIGVYFCSVGPSGSGGPGAGDRKRLDAVRALLGRDGTQRARAGPDDLCNSVAPRREPFVWVEPALN